MEQERGSAGRPLRAVVHRRHHVTPPAHHVVVEAIGYGQALLNSLPSWPALLTVPPKEPEELYSTERTSVFLNAGPKDVATSANASIPLENDSDTPKNLTRTGFQNPWESWHKATASEVWNGLRWTDKEGHTEHKGHADLEAYRTAIEEARRRENGRGKEDKDRPTAQDEIEDSDEGELATSQTGLLKDHQLQGSDLGLHRPNFAPSSHDNDMVRATWLGHASTLLQLPPSSSRGGQPIRILFDPIFSQRCSPTQYVGPSRLYSAPCSVADLPSIDVVCISHSHYDHLDYDSIVQLWHTNADRLRFIVPLGNKAWFLNLGLAMDEERVTELDWWDEVWLTDDGNVTTAEETPSSPRTRVICTPAQHGSGRYGFDAGRSLWSSWFVEYDGDHARRTPFRAFFGGDSGFQFHSSSPQATHYPACPAFGEVFEELGMPHLSFLPISVGATFNFVKSYDAFGVVPELDNGLTGANHMTPYDAVRVAKILAGQPGEQDQKHEAKDTRSSTTGTPSPGALTMAIHWGTFVSGMDEVRRSMQQVESACQIQGVQYAHRHDDDGIETVDPGQARFICIDHGRSIWVPLPST